MPDSKPSLRNGREERGSERDRELPAATQHCPSLTSRSCFLFIFTMAFWTQLMLLLWKNLLYRRRQPVTPGLWGTGWVASVPLTVHHYWACCVSPRSSSWWNCYGLSFSSSSWWPSAIPTPQWSGMNVSLQGPGTLYRGEARGRLIHRGPSERVPGSTNCQHPINR